MKNGSYYAEGIALSLYVIISSILVYVGLGPKAMITFGLAWYIPILFHMYVTFYTIWDEKRIYTNTLILFAFFPGMLLLAALGSIGERLP